jgi:Ca2+-binding RTX toxin-like protein
MAVLTTAPDFSLDTTNMTQLGLLGNWGQLRVQNTFFGKSSFTATKGDVTLEIIGSNLTVIGEQPISGIVKQINVKINGDTIYTIKNLNVILTVIDPTFSGNWESSLLGNKDNITGSNGEGDHLFGFGGADIINGQAGNDYIDGGTAGDTLRGGDDDDTVKGQAGADTLAGGTGVNTLTGGSGNDTFVFNSEVDGINISHITDFAVDRDLMRLSLADFAGLAVKGALSAAKFGIGTAAAEGQYIIYNATTGDLSFNASGAADGALTKFAALDAGLGLSAGDFVVSA